MEYIENLEIMMNWMILKFFKESNRTESLFEFTIDIFSIFVRKKQCCFSADFYCFSLTKIENISIESSDKLSVLLLSLKNCNITWSYWETSDSRQHRRPFLKTPSKSHHYGIEAFRVEEALEGPSIGLSI